MRIGELVVAAALLAAGYAVATARAEVEPKDRYVMSAAGEALILDLATSYVYYCRSPDGVPVCSAGTRIHN